MSKNSLQTFTGIVTTKGRIGFGDVRRFELDILPDGVASRKEADLLIRLDRGIARQDPAWIDWLVRALVDYVVWGERPTGYINADKADWITAALDGGGRRRLLRRSVVASARRRPSTSVSDA